MLARVGSPSSNPNLPSNLLPTPTETEAKLASAVVGNLTPAQTNGAEKTENDGPQVQDTPGAQIVRKQVQNSNANGGGGCGFLGSIISVLTSVIAPIFSFVTPFADFVSKTFSPITGAIDAVKGLFGGGKQEASDPNAAAEAKAAREKKENAEATARTIGEGRRIVEQNGGVPPSSNLGGRGLNQLNQLNDDLVAPRSTLPGAGLPTATLPVQRDGLVDNT